MDLARAFPDFDPARVVFRGDGLFVVDKPAGIPSQASDPEVPDDLPSRLRAMTPYLGTHQRLDAETSGLVLFTTERSANAGIAAQFEKRRVKKTYLACVTGWPHRPGPGKDKRTTLTHVLEGKRAVTHVRVLERRGERALLELELETGRTHQARDQLARAGAPIAGDRVYGGSPAPRLMLHASALAVVSPSGKPLVLQAPTPPEMSAWLEHGDRGTRVYEDDATLRAALGLAFERRWGLLRAMPAARATTVFRLANEGGDGLPGLAIDYYAGYAVVSFTLADLAASTDPPQAGRREHQTSAKDKTRVLDAIASFGFDGVYEKTRPKHASGLSDAEREAMAPAAPSRGSAAPSPLVVMEEGVPLLVRLSAGLATGLYADQRKNRKRVRAQASGQRVLNLFSYTCAFSVVAALGGASRTVSVDASASALEWGRESFAHAGIDLTGHEFVAMDARAYLERAARRSERFDLVILDPPSFGRAKGARFSLTTDFPALCALAYAVLDDRGTLLASINHEKTTQDRFRHMVEDAAHAAGKTPKVRDLPPPLDYPGGHMKAVWSSPR
jgi:23S rRNA (cytosine1962-C5)-methyltransferase